MHISYCHYSELHYFLEQEVVEEEKNRKGGERIVHSRYTCILSLTETKKQAISGEAHFASPEP